MTRSRIALGAGRSAPSSLRRLRRRRFLAPAPRKAGGRAHAQSRGAGDRALQRRQRLPRQGRGARAGGGRGARRQEEGEAREEGARQARVFDQEVRGGDRKESQPLPGVEQSRLRLPEDRQVQRVTPGVRPRARDRAGLHAGHRVPRRGLSGAESPGRRQGRVYGALQRIASTPTSWRRPSTSGSRRSGPSPPASIRPRWTASRRGPPSASSSPRRRARFSWRSRSAGR